MGLNNKNWTSWLHLDEFLVFNPACGSTDLGAEEEEDDDDDVNTNFRCSAYQVYTPIWVSKRMFQHPKEAERRCWNLGFSTDMGAETQVSAPIFDSAPKLDDKIKFE